MYGLSAMDFIHDNLKFRKSWVFFDNEISALSQELLQPRNNPF
ncbi:MAG: hypothetical protein COA79_01295 [Planctomycetota bacterium]|nr:MAG: hypothetical protein COA79_01295 [Planctomycetota bacterium]